MVRQTRRRGSADALVTSPHENERAVGASSAATPTARDILVALNQRHARRPYQRQENWAIFPEFRCGTGYARKPQSNDVESRIDLLAVSLWPSTGEGVIAYEVKVSRSDFLSEIKKPSKRRPAMRYSNQFFFAAPAGLVKPTEIPYDCGLIEVSPAGACRVVVPAPWRDDFHPTYTFVASVCRRVAQEASDESPAGPVLDIQ